mmetsp:Transcript_99980/g.229472  ORF Transcript_99980/g.229472 Transcript_99980/m.229472 type:complete len:246 (+) Transcript_99980:652-1389(+)
MAALRMDETSWVKTGELSRRRERLEMLGRTERDRARALRPPAPNSYSWCSWRRSRDRLARHLHGSSPSANRPKTSSVTPRHQARSRESFWRARPLGWATNRRTTSSFTSQYRRLQESSSRLHTATPLAMPSMAAGSAPRQESRVRRIVVRSGEVAIPWPRTLHPSTVRPRHWAKLRVREVVLSRASPRSCRSPSLSWEASILSSSGAASALSRRVSTKLTPPTIGSALVCVAGTQATDASHHRIR